MTRRLGGDTSLLHGTNVADALLDFAAQNGISTLVLGRTRERPLARMFNRTLTQQLLQRGAHYELVIVSSADARARARQRWRHPRQWLQRYDLVFAAIAAAGAVGVAWLLQRWTDINDLSMVFIVAVVLVASRTRMAAAVVAALLSFVAYNFFFIEPRFTLQISARQGVVTVCMFLIAALVAGRLASRLRSQVLALRAANAHANVLQALARQLSTAADLARCWKPAVARWPLRWMPTSGYAWSSAKAMPPPASVRSIAAPPIGPSGMASPPAASPIPWPARSGGACRCAMSAVHWASLRCAFVRACNGPVWNNAAWPKRWWKTSARRRYAPAWSPIWKAHV